MGARVVALVMYDEKMYRGRGHVVYDWAARIERRFTATAKAEAPSRSGTLKRLISGSVTRTGVRQLDTKIVSKAAHSLYVIKGTTGPIYASHTRANGKPGYLILRPGNGFPGGYAKSVAGQSPNNFFGRAAAAVAARHSSLIGFQPGSQFVSFKRSGPNRGW
jgi:hypothetical protein